MVIGFTQQVGQLEFLKKSIKERIQEIVAGFHVGGPGMRAAEGLESRGDLLDTLAHELLATTGLGTAKQIVRLVMARSSRFLIPRSRAPVALCTAAWMASASRCPSSGSTPATGTPAASCNRAMISGFLGQEYHVSTPLASAVPALK